MDILILLALILFVLAGLNVEAKRFAPQWFAFAALVLAWYWPNITA